MMLLRKLDKIRAVNEGVPPLAEAPPGCATVLATRVNATESCSKYGSEKSICFWRSSVTNMSAMITSIFPLTSAGIRAPKSWSSSRSSLPMYAANRLASSTSKPASCPSWTALKGKPPLEMPTTSVP